MPSFPKPQFAYTVNLAKEITALTTYRDTKPGRQIPPPKNKTIRLATWNIANLGAQDRELSHLTIIATILTWFDIIAIQETKENSTDFQKIVGLMGSNYSYIFCDEGGNNERMAFIYNNQKLTLLQEIAELALPPAEYKHIQLPGVTQSFNGFDRSPYMASFAAGKFKITLLNVHLYYGKDDAASIDRRCLEAFAVGRWADLRSKSKYAYTSNVFALGDFNLPKVSNTDPVYKALLKKGLQLPDHTSLAFSNIVNDKAYDQIAFLPGMKSKVLQQGIFDFDGAVFADLFNTTTIAAFRSYIRYYISDHRPLWIELDIS